MDGLIGDYLLASKLDTDNTWDWTDSDDWEAGLDAIRAVHFHTVEVTEEELVSLLKLSNLEAVAFCEDHAHSEASLERIAKLVEQKGIVDLEFEVSEHLPWLARFPQTRRLRLDSICDMSEVASWAPVLAAENLRELFLNSVDIDDEALRCLAGLTGLTRLVLDGNDELTDLTPLAALTSLESLGLSATEIKDLAPISGLTGLKQLDLSHTEVQQLAPLSGLTALEELDLQELKIADPDLGHLEGLAGLKKLNLSGCPVGDAGLERLRGVGLEELRLAGTRVSSALLRELCPQGWNGMFDEDAHVATARAAKDSAEDWDWIPVSAWEGDAADLRAVRLRDTYLPDPGGFDFLVFATGLEHLDVTNMTLTPSDVDRIGALTSLRELHLGGVDLEDPAIDDEDDEEAEEPELDDARITALLAGLPDLEVLDLGGATLTAAGADALAKLPKLRRLGLGGVGVKPFASTLSGLALEALALPGSDVDDATLATLAKLRLRELNLAGNPITAAGLTSLDPASLETLVLDQTRVEDLSWLKGCAGLKKLGLDGAPLDDASAAEVLATLTGLEALTLTGASVGDAVAGALSQLPVLEALSLRKTQVTDAAIPGLIGAGLKSLDLGAVWLSDASKEALEAASVDVTVSSVDDDDEPRPPFAGLEQARFTGALPANVAEHAWRLSVPAYDAEFPLEVFMRRFLDDPRVAEVEALVIGSWEEPFEGPPTRTLELLAERGAALPKLRALAIADMDSDECEVSWIQHGDVSPLVAAFPRLEILKIRGAVELQFTQPIAHTALRELGIECGGLPAGVLQQIACAQLPALETLDLFLGTEEYGWSEEGLMHLTPILSGKLFPKLRHLGLRDCEQQDAVAALVASAPVVEQLESLDLSLGTLGDEGAAALLASPAVARLKRLNLMHHYMSDEMVKRIEALPPEVNVSQQQEPDDWGDGELHRYVALGE